jgi:hypothetical protein
MPEEDWSEKRLKLKKKHTWKAKPGYAICAINRGAIRFDYPEKWDIDADSDSLKIRDRKPPDDNCVLAVSQMHLPRPVADIVPLREMLDGVTTEDERKVISRGKAISVPREDGIDMSYKEIHFIDPKEKREAMERICIARGSGVYCLITWDVWVEDIERYDYVWQEAIRSLVLGVYVNDPTAGPVVQ